MKNSSDAIGSLTGDHLGCIALPRLTASPRAPEIKGVDFNQIRVQFSLSLKVQICCIMCHVRRH
jgi:hypothetical protein